MGTKENFSHNLKKAMRQHEADRHEKQKALESLIADLEYYYEVDLTNCTMTHMDWIKELAKAMTNDNYKIEFQKELKEYQEARDEKIYF